MFKTEKDSIMETTAYTSDNIITRSYEEYHQVILNYITYRIAHRYEAEDLTQDVFVRLMDYKQMLRPDTVKYFLFTIARNLVTDYIRRYYKKQEIDSYLYDFTVTSSNDTEEKIIADDLMAMERTRLAAMPVTAAGDHKAAAAGRCRRPLLKLRCAARRDDVHVAGQRRALPAAVDRAHRAERDALARDPTLETVFLEKAWRGFTVRVPAIRSLMVCSV